VFELAPYRRRIIEPKSAEWLGLSTALSERRGLRLVVIAQTGRFLHLIFSISRQKLLRIVAIETPNS